ncbi:MAG: hypothetical protein AB7V46_08705 [Thermomicrobiales bacterium]
MGAGKSKRVAEAEPMLDHRREQKNRRGQYQCYPKAAPVVRDHLAVIVSTMTGGEIGMARPGSSDDLRAAGGFALWMASRVPVFTVITMI